jgi:flagellar protein FlaG
VPVRPLAPGAGLRLALELSLEDRASLDQAVSQLNDHFAQKRTDLKFRIDDVLNSVVVSVVESEDGTVLQQIPSEVALRIARSLAESNSGLIKAEA